MSDTMRKGDWMQTASGGVFWPMDPRPSEVRIEDIAHSLANMCRYAGHCREFYSVAQHSVIVSMHVPAGDALWGLMHDASEAYLVDVPKPVKRFLAGYQEIEFSVMRAVSRAFGLPEEMPQSVKRADAAILADEAAHLMGPAPRPWGLTVPPLGVHIDPLPPIDARRLFLDRFTALTAEASE